MKSKLAVVAGMMMVGGAMGASGAPLHEGHWRAFVETPGGELPFGLELQRDGEGWSATIRNGGERIDVPVVEVRDGEVTLGIDYFDAQITAKVGEDGRTMSGQYSKRRGPTNVASMRFGAEVSNDRFRVPDTGGAMALPLPGRWRIRFGSEAQDAVGMFYIGSLLRDPGAHVGVTGTILTTTGDYRFLEGDWDGKTLRLSAFDGAHAFLFKGQIQGNRTLVGDFWSGNHFHDTWTAVPDETVTLPDAWSLNDVDADRLEELSFPDGAGNLRSLAEPELRGRATIIEVFGTWCPNCKDATDYLVELHGKYAERGLAIVGLAFEITGDAERDAAQVKTYMDRRSVPYTVLVAGLADKAKASEAFPAIDAVKAYPTTIFLDEEGRVRAVYTGFSGPATSEEHTRLRQQWEGLIEELLETE